MEKMTSAAYAALADKDPDKLYFVNASGTFGPDSMETGGDIYLGDKLLAAQGHYGTCGTAAATAAKVASVTGTVSLVAGMCILVKFTYANTASSPTLNVNGTGAVAIKRYGTTDASTSAAGSWNANSIVQLVYDGTYWILTGWLNTTYSAATATASGLMTAADFKKLNPQTIPANADLNSYTTEGCYVVTTAATAATLANHPPVSAGFQMWVVRVASTNRLKQLALANENGNKAYVRYYNGTWGAWMTLGRHDRHYSLGATTPATFGAERGAIDSLSNAAGFNPTNIPPGTYKLTLQRHFSTERALGKPAFLNVSVGFMATSSSSSAILAAATVVIPPGESSYQTSNSKAWAGVVTLTGFLTVTSSFNTTGSLVVEYSTSSTEAVTAGGNAPVDGSTGFAQMQNDFILLERLAE